MLFDAARHEPLRAVEWDEQAGRRMIERVVRDTEDRFSPASHWPMHPLDADGHNPEPVFCLYFGSAGVVWALRYLQAVGSVQLRRSYEGYIDALVPLNRAWLRSIGSSDTASYLMGDTGILLLSYWLKPSEETGARLEELIAGNLENPARELMWGAPGTLLAALFLHEWTREPCWADLYRATARKLWSQLVWSPEHNCHYWTQDLYGRRSTFLDGVHGFVATAAPIIKGRHLLESDERTQWERRIVQTVRNTADREGPLANWRPFLFPEAGSTGRAKMLMQYCHGAPGFIICLADLPSRTLDDLLLAGGEATWAAGPLRKGSNLCHGTGGNGYAFLKLYERTGDELWLSRARAFAMHAIAQTESDAEKYEQLRYSLWTGDPGLAIYLRDCIRGKGAFPSLDVFFA
jgi:hypothetical protein